MTSGLLLLIPVLAIGKGQIAVPSFQIQQQKLVNDILPAIPQPIRLYSDHRTLDMLQFWLGFAIPETVSLTDWNKPVPARPDEKLLLLIDLHHLNRPALRAWIKHPPAGVGLLWHMQAADGEGHYLFEGAELERLLTDQGLR